MHMFSIVINKYVQSEEYDWWWHVRTVRVVWFTVVRTTYKVKRRSIDWLVLCTSRYHSYDDSRREETVRVDFFFIYLGMIHIGRRSYSTYYEGLIYLLFHFTIYAERSRENNAVIITLVYKYITYGQNMVKSLLAKSIECNNL